MTNGNADRPSKNQRRDAARDKARQLREEQRKRDKRNRVLLQGGIAIVVVAIVAIIAVVIVNSVKPAGPGPKNMASDGIIIGADLKAVTTPALAVSATPTPSEQDTTGNVASIRIYLDYLCPFCNQFEQTNNAQLQQLVESGAATVEYHPIALLASNSLGTKYSTRATNAAACVANYSPDDFWAFNKAMFDAQPEEGTAGLTDAQIVKVVSDAGVGSMSKIKPCINDKTFTDWANAETDRALNDPVPNSDLPSVKSTPTILVNGKQYSGSLTDASEFRSFLVQAAGDTYSTATPTPTPTPAG